MGEAKSVASKRAIQVTSVIAGALWLGVLGFLGKWFAAHSLGNLDPGEGTSFTTLMVLFGIALAMAVIGITVSIKGWMGWGERRWHVVSLVLAGLTLWAAAGH